MSLELCILASGSSGNCSVLRAPSGTMLIDAGIGPRMAAARLAGTEVRIADISAICLTHLDHDHFTRTWARTISRLRIRVFCHAARLQELLEIGHGLISANVEGFDDAFEPLPGVAARPVALAHDRLGSDGFVFEGFGRRIGYATDLGRVPRELIERFIGLDILALESNYDPQMQRDSGRPWFLQQRITGGRGHLSNQQALAAIRTILDACESHAARMPDHIVLLHRSLQCNCPELVRRLFSADRRIRRRLMLADQFARSEWLRASRQSARPHEQLMLAWE